MAELEREASVAELEHETPMPEVTEVPRFEVPMLPEEAAVVELEAVMRPMKFCACVRGEMAEGKAAVASLHGHGCEQHDLAHRLAP